MEPKKPRGALLPRLKAQRESVKRDDKPLSRADLARDTGLDYSFLWMLENGRARASYGTLLALSRCLNLSVEELTADA
jgi:transcriptional regulator with XRE-family HTH domain